MTGMTAADHNIICELKLSARPEQFELLRHVLGIIEQQEAVIAKKDRMLRRATTELDNAGYCAIGGGMPDDMQHCDNAGGNYSCADCWLAWLEKEAQGVE